jgi:TRAP-type C4-dicarboxylate transport system substrate-binding protein
VTPRKGLQQAGEDQMSFRSSSTAVLLTAGLSLSGAAIAPAQAADYTLKYGVVTQGDMQHLYGLQLKEVVEKNTNGRVEVKVFPGGQLGSPQAHIEGLQLGTIEGYSNPADFFAGVDSRFGVFSIPFLFKDRDHANRTLADPELKAYILNMAESKGIIGVNLVAQAESHYFAKNPIRRLADFNGKKLRVNATPAERARMQAFGATAVPMGLGEMITSLQNGVIDGTMSGISIYVNFNLQNVSKTITETNDTLLVSYGALSKPWLDKLPADLRKTVVDSARSLQAWAIKQSNDEKVALRAKWIERGGEIIHLPPEDMVELQKRLKPIGAEITKTDPNLKAFYDKVVATSAKY